MSLVKLITSTKKYESPFAFYCRSVLCIAKLDISHCRSNTLIGIPFHVISSLATLQATVLPLPD